MSVFAWVAGRGDLPRQWDLRRVGWMLSQAVPRCAEVWLVDMRASGPAMACKNAVEERARCLFLGVDCGRERARLLESGAGDALTSHIELSELDVRARRVAAANECLPRRLQAGPLTLELFHRDARIGRSWLALHPREFALLWRLAERPGELVSRALLLRDVWRLEFEPGTNSVEVHVSRLRAKLVSAGVEGLVVTGPEGGYRLSPAPADLEGAFAGPLDQSLCA